MVQATTAPNEKAGTDEMQEKQPTFIEEENSPMSALEKKSVQAVEKIRSNPK
jgi:hypothetical protein